MKKYTRNRFIYSIQLILTITLIYWFYKQFYSPEILIIISQIDPIYLTLAVIAIVIEMSVRSFRWSIPFSHTNNVPHKDLLGCMFLSYFISEITPSRTGDAAAIIILNKVHGIKLAVATAVTYLEKVYDLSLLGASTILSILILSSYNLNLQYLLNATLITILAIFTIPILIAHNRTLQILEKIFVRARSYIIPNKQSSNIFKRLYELSSDFYSSLKLFSSLKMISSLLIITIAIWTFYCLRFYLVLKSTHIGLDNITFQTFAVLTIFIFAISIIPVSLGGLGIKEMSAVLIFGVFGFDTYLMAAAVIVDRIITVGTHTITGLPYLIKYIDILKIKETHYQ